MTLEEFSNLFDTLVSSYRRFRDFDNKEPLDTIEFNEYEKSLYLTKAQEEVVLGLYNGRNPSGESFEQTEELRRYLSSLVAEANLQPTENSTGILGIDSQHKFFTLPEDVWFITYESVVISNGKCEGSNSLDVYPVTQDEYHKVKRNPFRGANDRRALRLDLSDGVIEIISKYTVTAYYLRYLKKLKPIILVDLPNGLTIGHTDEFEGNEATPCGVHEGLHQRILERAVLLGLQSKGIKVENSENR